MSSRSGSAVHTLPAVALLVALVLAPREAAAGVRSGSVFVGAGVSAMKVSSDVTTPASLATWELSFGYRPWGFREYPWSRFSWELTVTGKGGAIDMPASASYPAEEADFSLLSVGFRFDIFAPAHSRWTPWLGVAAGIAMLSGDARAEAGVGAVFGAGIDLQLRAGLMLRARLSTVRIGSAESLEFAAGSLSLVWEFLRPPHHRRPEWGEPVPPEPQEKPQVEPNQSPG